MENRVLLEDKQILIVDDEMDVLDTLEDLLPECDVTKASTFDKAKELLESRYFDIAVLDIMGVAGFKLLEIANRRGVMAVMLTGHAHGPENAVRSYREGAASYVPKESMNNIHVFLNDILEGKAKGKSPWWRWSERFGSYFEKRFGLDWQKKAKKQRTQAPQKAGLSRSGRTKGKGESR
jgi:DNA-binding NtrC family response regulator